MSTQQFVLYCDKCGKSVPLTNDAVCIAALAFGNSLGRMIYQARHFLPTDDCEGSPSRAQYIEGQGRDTRPGAEYDPELELVWREAYALAQRDSAPMSTQT